MKPEHSAKSGPPRVGIVGGGTWGSALAVAATRAGAEVTLLSRREQVPEGARFAVTDSLATLAAAPLIVLAVPSQVLRDVARSLGDHLTGGHLVVHAVRGLEPETLVPLSEVVRAETPVRRVGALGGPVQADELRAGQPSSLICGARFPEVVAAVTTAFRSRSLLVHSTTDLHGLEWASALVGCLAVGAGFARQAGAGPGLLAALISRGVDESARLLAAVGAEERTMLGLAGYGDLLASIAQEKRPEIVLGKALAEGATMDAARERASLRVEAVTLIPRLVAYARERKLYLPVFQALESMLGNTPAPVIVERMFAMSGRG